MLLTLFGWRKRESFCTTLLDVQISQKTKESLQAFPFHFRLFLIHPVSSFFKNFSFRKKAGFSLDSYQTCFPSKIKSLGHSKWFVPVQHICGANHVFYSSATADPTTIDIQRECLGGRKEEGPSATILA